MAEPVDLDTKQPPTRPVRRVTASISAFQGPLPPPELLERYNQIVPNGADRIVAMAESQMLHRQSLESAVVLGNIKAQSGGQTKAFILGLIAILGGIGLIAFDKNSAGLAAIMTFLLPRDTATVMSQARAPFARDNRLVNLSEARRKFDAQPFHANQWALQWWVVVLNLRG